MPSSSASAAPLRVDTPSPCVVCRLPLPIQPVSDGEVGEYWSCIRCGTKHLCRLIENPPADCARNVRPADDTFAELTSSIERRAAMFGSLGLGDPSGVATKPLPARGGVMCELQTQLSRKIDESLARGVPLAAPTGGSAFLNAIQMRGARAYDDDTEAAFVEQYDDSLRQLESLVASLEQGDSLNPDAPRTIARETLVKAAQDLDLFVRIGINPPTTGYPSRHSLHVAMLASAIGANLGWDESTLVELGVGCLLHDVGMLKIPDRLYGNDRVLDDTEFREIVKHPLYTVDALAGQLERVPLVSRMVAYQTHERCDGSGYPRNRRSDLIHEAAKVAAVADVYVALVSSRPHRPALMPYFAVEHILFGVKQGLFDTRVVRALLRTISLFPIGSYVKLSDGRLGRVLRAGGEQYTRPIVEAWRPGALDRTPEIVDLAKASDLTIEGPLPKLTTR